MGTSNNIRPNAGVSNTSSPEVPSVVFNVANVTPAKSVLPEVPYKSSIEALLTRPPSYFPGNAQPTDSHPRKQIEACSRYHGQLVADVFYHPVVAAIHLAFQDHRPLVLSPDILWLLLAQGFAHHVNAHAEDLRPKIVNHPGKLTIVVRRDDFLKGSPENPWQEVFSAFSSQIRDHLGDGTHDLLVPRFSTTGGVERAAAEIALLDAMKSYFSYEFHTLCGIPQIVLEGTPEDWEALANRAHGLAQFGLQWWTEVLGPILDEFAQASRGKVNERFWGSIYKVDGGSGGPYISGWITGFFPYLKDWQTGQAKFKNPWLEKGGKDLQDLLYPPTTSDDWFGNGPTTDAFPGGLARAPFLWNYLGQSFEMEFLGGFVGVRQAAETLRLRPEIGWAIREQTSA